MQGSAVVLDGPQRSWICSAGCRRAGLFCFSLRNPPKAKSKLQSNCFSYRLVNYVALLAGNGLSSNLSCAVCPVTSVPFLIPIRIVRNGQALICCRPGCCRRGCCPPSGTGLSLAPRDEHEMLAAPFPPSAQSLQAAALGRCPLLSSS